MPAPLDLLDAAVAAIAVHTAGRARAGRGHDDGDDVHGSIDTDSALGFDPRPLLATLHGHGVRAVVIGQVAGILHGSPELTGDLDLLWSGRADEAARIAAAFAAAGAKLVDDDGRPIPCDTAAFLLPKVQFVTEAASGDCCTPKLRWGTLAVTDFLDRALVTGHGAGTVHYLNRDDLVAMGRAAGRPKDLRRVAWLDEMCGRPAGAPA